LAVQSVISLVQLDSTQFPQSLAPQVLESVPASFVVEGLPLEVQAGSAASTSAAITATSTRLFPQCLTPAIFAPTPGCVNSQ
jgi:hypothetical protein